MFPNLVLSANIHQHYDTHTLSVQSEKLFCVTCSNCNAKTGLLPSPQTLCQQPALVCHKTLPTKQAPVDNLFSCFGCGARGLPLTSFSFCTSNNEVYASKYTVWQVFTASSPLNEWSVKSSLHRQTSHLTPNTGLCVTDLTVISFSSYKPRPITYNISQTL